MSRFAFGLRYFLFGLGSALNTGEHVTWSIDLTQDCPNLCRAVCAILITPTAGTCRSSRQLKRNFSAVTFATQSATKRTPPALPEIGREASATVCAPLVVSLPWRVTARCPIVDPDLPPGRSAIPVLVAAMVLTARRLLRFLVLGRSFATQTMRSLRSLTETQLPSVWDSPTQDGLSAVVCAPATMGSRGTTVANGARLVAGVVSAMDASSARVTGAANLGPSAAVIIAAPTPATTRHASATRSLRRKRGVGQKKPNSG
jgi:hypothetical protein